MPAMKKYPPELKERAILLATSRVAAAVRAAVLGSSSVSTSVLYVLGPACEVDEDCRPGTTTDDVACRERTALLFTVM